MHGRLWLAISGLLLAAFIALTLVHRHISRYDDVIGLSASRYGLDF